MKTYGHAFSAYFWLIILVMFLIINNLNYFTYTQKIRSPSRDPKNYASFIISATGLLYKDNALGVTDLPICIACATNLIKSHIVLGFNEPIVNIAGDDFVVYEVDDRYNKDSLEVLTRDNYVVSGSNDQVNWIFIGYGHGVTAFDLASAKISSIKYLKISSMSMQYDSDIFNAYPSIDAVEVITSPE